MKTAVLIGSRVIEREFEQTLDSKDFCYLGPETGPEDYAEKMVIKYRTRFEFSETGFEYKNELLSVSVLIENLETLEETEIEISGEELAKMDVKFSAPSGDTDSGSVYIHDVTLDRFQNYIILEL